MIDALADSRLWRPQQFGSRRARDIPTPIIEPLWSGARVLATVADGQLELRDEAGGSVDPAGLGPALVAAVASDAAIIDGYLSPEAARSGVGIEANPGGAAPTAGEMARQMFVGSGRNRRTELVEAMEARTEAPLLALDPVAFVAVDLLLLDGDPLLDVPLLERKRLLGSIVTESELVRVGIHVRLPVDPWLATWRGVGFRSIAYKDPNGRYVPGERNDGWATAAIPRT